jgi:hypothetical protein
MQVLKSAEPSTGRLAARPEVAESRSMSASGEATHTQRKLSARERVLNT